MGSTRMVWTLPADAASVPVTRQRVMSVLCARGWNQEHIDDAALMTSELATNAVTHAATPFTVVVEVADQKLRVDIHDASVELPVADLAASPMALGGRGLALVAALSDRWG